MSRQLHQAIVNTFLKIEINISNNISGFSWSLQQPKSIDQVSTTLATSQWLRMGFIKDAKIQSLLEEVHCVSFIVWWWSTSVYWPGFPSLTIGVRSSQTSKLYNQILVIPCVVSLCVLSDQKVLTLIVKSIKLPAYYLPRNFNNALLSHHNLCGIAFTNAFS